MNTVDCLKEVRSLVDTPDKWVKNCLSVDAEGNYVVPWEPTAVSFCIVGAIARVNEKHGDKNNGIFTEIRSTLMGVLNRRNFQASYLPSWNNDESTTHEDLLSVIDEAIEDMSK